ASSTDFKTWCSFKDAVDAAGKFSGIGFVCTDQDCYVGIDLDGCRDPETRQLDEWAKEIVLQFGSYAEVSPSKTGVKIFGSSGVRWPHRNKVDLSFPNAFGKQPG